MAGADPVVGVGAFGISGNLSGDQVSEILAANKYKGWLYLLPEDGPESPAAAVKTAGLDFSCIPISMPDGLTKDNAQRVAKAIENLPRPTMIQCSSGSRASAALLFFLAQQQKLGLEAAQSLGSTLGLRCMAMKPMLKWMDTAIESETSGDVGDILFRHLFDKESSTNTYLLADPKTKEAIIIDPVVEQVDRDFATADDLGLNLLYAINTHCHADHITGTGEIKKRRPGVQSGISKASGAVADILYEAGDVIRFGAHQLEVVSTPGHTNGCVTYYTKSGGGMCFTGDTLLIRGCGRTDFQEGDPSMLYESVHTRLFTLPESTVVYPAHDYRGRTSSTVGEEKRFNPRLTRSKEEFIDIMNNLGLPYPKKMDVAHPANMVCGVHEVE